MTHAIIQVQTCVANPCMQVAVQVRYREAGCRTATQLFKWLAHVGSSCTKAQFCLWMQDSSVCRLHGSTPTSGSFCAHWPFQTMRLLTTQLLVGFHQSCCHACSAQLHISAFCVVVDASKVACRAAYSLHGLGLCTIPCMSFLKLT